MSILTQSRIVAMMIEDDEMSIAVLLSKIRSTQKDLNGEHTIKQSKQIALWRGTMLTLGRGLEGLRLKRDSLLECKT